MLHMVAHLFLSICGTEGSMVLLSMFSSILATEEAILVQVQAIHEAMFIGPYNQYQVRGFFVLNILH